MASPCPWDGGGVRGGQGLLWLHPCIKQVLNAGGGVGWGGRQGGACPAPAGTKEGAEHHGMSNDIVSMLFVGCVGQHMTSNQFKHGFHV